VPVYLIEYTRNVNGVSAVIVGYIRAPDVPPDAYLLKAVTLNPVIFA
jgi:hypothetical protein